VLGAGAIFCFGTGFPVVTARAATVAADAGFLTVATGADFLAAGAGRFGLATAFAGAVRDLVAAGAFVFFRGARAVEAREDFFAAGFADRAGGFFPASDLRPADLPAGLDFFLAAMVLTSLPEN